ncbi:MAG TPA: hypothetical protein VER55_12215, partial [Ardenticatenaceae bacterium]|nr:hypothetical protein [Ardenticatenaceae bacterium]
MINRAYEWCSRHRDFLLLLVLFATLRLFVVGFMRAGGLWLDYTDYWWYYQVAALTDSGYLVWRDFWSDYPPLFYPVVVALYRLASTLPTWTQPALWFYVFFGSLMALAEAANFALLYWLALRLYPEPPRSPQTPVGPAPLSSPGVRQAPSMALRPLWLYAGLFGPVFVVAGYFDQFTLFWLLLALVLVARRRYALSALPAGIGFMIKLFPVLIAPAAFKLAPLRSKFGFVVALALTVFAANLPFFLLNPTMFVASWRAMVGQPSWETVWALLDGYRSLGMLQGNRFDPADATAGARPETLPWFAVVGLFGLIYLSLWIRPWEGRGELAENERVRRLVAFVGLTIALFFVFSKGWSPQFIAWLVPFAVLLMPNGWGVAYSLLLSALAVIERIIAFLLLSTSTWMLEWIIYLRTALLVVLVVEFALQAGLVAAGRWERVRQLAAVPAVVLLAALAGIGAGHALGDYRAMMAANTPYRPVLDRLAPLVGPGDPLVTTTRESFDAISSHWPGPVRVWTRLELEERAHAWEPLWAQLIRSAPTVWLLQDYSGGLNAPWNQELERRLAANGYAAHDEWLSEQQRLLAFALGEPAGTPRRSAACFADSICLSAWHA